MTGITITMGKEAIYETIEINGRQYITTQRLHRDVQPTSELKATNRSIRNMETYDELVESHHIVEVNLDTAKTLTGADLVPVIKSNGYNPIMLIDAVAQKAIEHHFKETSSQAIHSARENATLAAAGIDLKVLAADPQTMMLLKALSQAEVAKKKAILAHETAIQAKQLAKQTAERLALMDGDSGYETIVAFARRKKIPMPGNLAKELGKKARELCSIQGFPIGKVPDEKWGAVNSYPKEMIEKIFAQSIWA